MFRSGRRVADGAWVDANESCGRAGSGVLLKALGFSFLHGGGSRRGVVRIISGLGTNLPLHGCILGVGLQKHLAIRVAYRAEK